MKQGAPTSEDAAFLPRQREATALFMCLTLKVWRVGGARKILSFVICMQIPLLHKLTSEPRVTPHLVKSRAALSGSETVSSFIVADGSQTLL